MDPLPPTPSSPETTPDLIGPTPVIEPLASSIPLQPVPPKFNVNKKIIILVSIILIIILLVSSLFAFKYLNDSILQTPSPTIEASPTPLPTIVADTPFPLPISTASPNPAPGSLILTLVPQKNSDAFFADNGTGNINGDLRIGRNTYAITRTFLSFDLAKLPKNAKVETAILRLYQTAITGDPYTIGASLKVDHMDLGPTLEAEDYSLPALQANFATVTSSTNIEWKEMVATEQVRFDAQSNRLLSQYRLHLSTERIGGQSGGDFAYFESADNFAGTGNLPQLVITYNLQ